MSTETNRAPATCTGTKLNNIALEEWKKSKRVGDVRFASREAVREAFDWVMVNYGGVMERLA